MHPGSQPESRGEKKKVNLAGDAKGKLLGLEAGWKGSTGKASAFAGGAREPTGSSSWGKDRWNDAAGLANREEFVPSMRSNNAASVGSEETWLEVKRPKKMASGV